MTPDPSCPVTLPNDQRPPGETATAHWFGNGTLWTNLWPAGVVLTTPDDIQGDMIAVKVPWWRGVSGKLSITGRRLDAEAGPAREFVPDGYGDVGFQATSVLLPTPGCWEVQGSVGDASLSFVMWVGEPRG